MSLLFKLPHFLVAPRNKIKTKKLKITKYKNNKPSILNSLRSIKETSMYTSFKKASYTLEAAVILPLFISLMMFGVFTFRVLEVESGIQNAINSASRQAAVALSCSDEEEEILNDEQLIASAIAYADILIEKNKVPLNFVRGGLIGLNYLGSSAEGNYVDINVSYDVKFPIGLLGHQSFPISQRAKCRKWIGYDTSESAWDGTYVYVTETGTVYHTSLNCSYLNLSIQSVNYSSVSKLRNKSGAKYYTCKSCKADKNNGTVYITDYGRHYHSDINCSDLKRTVHKVLLSTVENTMNACSKCGNE